MYFGAVRRDTVQRAGLSLVVVVAVTLGLVWVGAPEFVARIAVGVLLGLSHAAAGAWTVWRTRAVPLGTHNFATEAYGWLEVERVGAADSATVVGLALPETTWDRLVMAADSAALNAGLSTPGLMAGTRMDGRQVIAGGPWPSDSTLFVDIEALAGDRSEWLVDAMALELGLVRRRVPLWGTIAVGVAATALFEIVTWSGAV